MPEYGQGRRRGSINVAGFCFKAHTVEQAFRQMTGRMVNERLGLSFGRVLSAGLKP